MKKILVIGAHFDDAELGVGGSMAKWKQENKDVYKLTLTDNVTDFKIRNIKVDYESSFQESAEACKLLGIREITHIPYEKCTELNFNKK